MGEKELDELVQKATEENWPTVQQIVKELKLTPNANTTILTYIRKEYIEGVHVDGRTTLVNPEYKDFIELSLKYSSRNAVEEFGVRETVINKLNKIYSFLEELPRSRKKYFPPTLYERFGRLVKCAAEISDIGLEELKCSKHGNDKELETLLERLSVPKPKEIVYNPTLTIDDFSVGMKMKYVSTKVKVIDKIPDRYRPQIEIEYLKGSKKGQTETIFVARSNSE